MTRRCHIERKSTIIVTYTQTPMYLLKAGFSAFDQVGFAFVLLSELHDASRR